MRVLELSLRNYRQFEEVDLELPAQVIGIFGANGAGKSTLMESIAVALYGVGAARTKKQEIRTHGLLTDCEIRLVFELAGQQYEVRRRLEGRGSTPVAELYGGGLLLAAGVGEVDAEVQRLLHMDLGVFRASVYAEQKQLDAFSDVTTGKRKEMALRLLGIRPVDDARRSARAEARASRQSSEQLAGAAGDLAALEADLKEATDLQSEAAELAERSAAEVEASASRAKALVASFERADAVRQEVEKLTVEIQGATRECDRCRTDRDRIHERVALLRPELEELPALSAELEGLVDAEPRLRAARSLEELGARVASLSAELEALPSAGIEETAAALAGARAAEAAARASLARAVAQRDHAAAALRAGEDRVARAAGADPSEPCPTCGQPLGEGFATYVRHAKTEAAGARRATTAAEKAVRAAERLHAAAAREATAAEQEGERARTRSDRRAQLQARLAEHHAEIASAAGPFEGEPPDVGALQAAVDRAAALRERIAGLRAERRHLDASVEQLEALESRLGELRARLAALTERAESLEFDPARHARLRADRDEAEAALSAAREGQRRASDAFARAQKDLARVQGRLEEARETDRKVEELRSEARHLDRTAMLLDGFRDHLVSRVGPDLSREAEAVFRDLTNHEYDDLRIDDETLAIQIADGDAYFPVERFSGSETDLANLALRIAISTHLSRVSGADLGMLVLDEVLGSLDQERKDLMVRTMGRLSGRFHQLFVVTHADQVKDAFPAAIEVAKLSRRRSAAALV